MPIKRVRDQLAHLKINTLDDMLAYGLQVITNRRALGIPTADQYDNTDPVYAFINNGRWIIRCPCGAGNAVDPDWTATVCFECSRVNRNIVYPDDYTAYEVELEKRQHARNQNWTPDESIEDLEEETQQHEGE